ncbi:hypothetical protein R1sor_014434 [Riccia sorocarpa]|uniref:Uncharacterized protein n=1 Tax=Riccia sorocarpa TaxID=122646 RepID=A0ABD3H9D6_9MARC
MVRDPGRAPSGLPPSQGGQPDRRERDRTHSTCASDLRTTPSTAGGGRPPPHPRKSSRSGAGASGSMSSGGRTPGVTTGAASRGSTPQTSIPVTTSAPTLSIPAAPATVMQDLIGRIFDVKLQQFASEMGLGSTPSRSGGGASTEQEDTTRRRRSRSSHADDAEPRSRRSRRSSLDADRDRRPQLVPLVELELDDLDIATRLAAKYGPISVRHKNAKARVESRREKNIMVTPTVTRALKKKFGVYPEPKHNAFLRLHGMKRVFEFMRTGREFPEVGQERVEELEDAEDDEEDEAIPLGPPSGVLRAIPRNPQPSVARTVTPQPSAARAVVSDPSRAQTTVPEPSSRQTRAQSQAENGQFKPYLVGDRDPRAWVAPELTREKACPDWRGRKYITFFSESTDIYAMGYILENLCGDFFSDMTPRERSAYDDEMFAKGFPTDASLPHVVHGQRLWEALDTMTTVNIANWIEHRRTTAHWETYFQEQLMVDPLFCQRPPETKPRQKKHPDGPREIGKDKL